jgi:ABC-type Zn uptake system ZnuABC Zn-binding protein ZnuA
MHRTRPSQLIFTLLAALFAFSTFSCQVQAIRPSSAEDDFLRSIDEIEPAQLGQGEKLNVVTTTNIVFDILKNVGREYVELETLIPRGADPHAYAPSPGDLRTLVQANLVFINGVDLEESLHPTLAEIAGDTVIVSLSEGLALMSFGEAEQAGEDEHDNDDYDHRGQDPHVWLDPLNVQAWTRNAAQSLSTIDPARADNYQINADAYVEELDQLHTWIAQRLDDIPSDQRKLVTDHRALGYFAARYDFELVATVIPAYSTAAEPSPRELGELIETIEAESVQAIFVGSNVNTSLAERVAEDIGIQVVPLYIGTLSPEDGPAADYISMMKYNVVAISAALSKND